MPSERTLRILETLEPIILPEPVSTHDTHFDRDGEPLTLAQWMMLWGDKSYQIVAQTRIGPLLVSTVWLGIDHGWGFSSEPIIFETMVFQVDEDPDARWSDVGDLQERYSTDMEALAGHEQICAQVRLLEELR